MTPQEREAFLMSLGPNERADAIRRVTHLILAHALSQSTPGAIRGSFATTERSLA